MFANILKQLGINETLWIQLGIFTVLYIFLRIVFFGPFLKLIELREKETGGVDKEAQELQKRAESGEAEYQAKFNAAKKQSKEAADKILAQAKSEAARRIADARGASKEKVEGARNILMKEAEAASEGIAAEAKKVAAFFVEKLMSSKVGL